ncbi:MAG: porin, partial [Pseudomonadota bacterium]|nr:porin [Pseudomonadota bacterium]
PTIIGGGGGANMFIYTSPDFNGVTITAAYQNDGGAVAVSNGSYSDFAIKISPEMVEGLTVGYGAGSVPVSGQDKEKDNSTAYVKYAVGGFTVGYQISESDHDTTSSSLDSMAYGVTYAVNDDFSVGYSYHETEFDSGASDNTDQQSTGISFSYTMGGMTLGGAMNEVESMDGVATGDYEGYEFNLSFAF